MKARRALISILAALLFSLSAVAQERVRVGVDASADFFLRPDKFPLVSGGLGIRARYGRPDQLVNAIAGLRYIYGPSLSGFQVPLLLNLNLLRAEAFSIYVGGGFEFDFIGRYWGCMKLQTGVAAGPHMDIRVFYKPYQGDLGAGFTYYF